MAGWERKTKAGEEDCMASNRDQDQEKLEEEYNLVLRNLNNFKQNNQMLQKGIVKLREKNCDLCDRVLTLEEGQQRYLQESAATEVLVMATFNNVGKFAREELFHYKKFVKNDYGLNDITDKGSLGKRRQWTILKHWNAVRLLGGTRIRGCWQTELQIRGVRYVPQSKEN
jgi:hypothetical protein